MAKINLKIESDFTQASQDLKKFGNLTEAEAQRVKKYRDSFKSESIDKFIDKNRRLGAAYKANKGVTASVIAQQKALERQSIALIKKGIDPQDDAIKSLNNEYNRLQKELEETGIATKKTTKSFDLATAGAVALGQGAVMLGKEVVSAFKEISRESLQLASDAEEIEGKFNVVFSSISDDAGETAKTIASDFDLASSTVMELLGNTGDLLTGFGLTENAALDLSEQTNRLALDLASFTNAQGGAEAVSKALTSAYAGEREALKTYGVVIRQTDVDSRVLENTQKGLTFESEKAAVAYATLQIATEQSKNAIGDYARTQESAANVERTYQEQIKRSKEILGDYLNEGLTPIRAFFRDFIKDLNDTIEVQKEFTDLMRAGDATDAIVDQLAGVEEFTRTFVAKFQATNNEVVRALEFNFGVTEQKALELLDSYGLLDEAGQQSLENIYQQQLKVNRSQEEANKLAQGIIESENRKTEASTRFEELRKESLTNDEKKLMALQSEINKWWEFKDVAEVGELLNELIRQRTELQEEQAEKLAEQKEKEAEQREKELEDEQALLDARLGFEDKWLKAVEDQADNRLAVLELEKNQAIKKAEELGADTTDIYKFYEEEQSKIAKEQSDYRINLKRAELRATGDLFAAVGDLITSFGNESKEAAVASKILASASAGINSYLAFTQALADPTKISPFKEINAASILASGLAAQVKIFNTSLPSFETGTPMGGFEVPATRSAGVDNVGVNVQPGETIDVRPRGESGKTQRIVVELDKQPIIDVVNDAIESQAIRITTDNIQGGLRA